MAKADKESPAEDEGGKSEAKPKKGMGLLLPILIAVVVSTAASGGVSFFIAKQMISGLKDADGHEGKEEKKAEEPKGPAVYVPLEPPFVVNIDDNGTSRFMQISVQLSTHDPKGAEEIKASEPRIRNDILMLFSQQKIEELGTVAGKEKLRATVLAAVQKILQEELGKPEVEAVYFTSFVIQ